MSEKSKKPIGARAAVAAVAAGLAAFAACRWLAPSGGGEGGEGAADGGRGAVRVSAVRPGGGVRGGGDDASRRRGARTAGGGAEARRSGADLRRYADEIDDAGFSEEKAKVFAALRAAFDADDFEAVRRAAERINLPKAKGGLGGKAPKELRSLAVQALGWHGGKAIGDLACFLSDADEDVENEAYMQLEMALDDAESDDLEKMEILKLLMGVLKDEERIDSILMVLNSMGDAAKADAILAVLEGGTPEAQAVMVDQVEFYTETSGDGDIETVEDAAEHVKDWIARNAEDAAGDDAEDAPPGDEDAPPPAEGTEDFGNNEQNEQ